MVASRVEGAGYFHIDNECFNEKLGKIIHSVLPVFKKIIKSHVRFNILFCLVIISEIVGLIVSYPLLIESSLFSFGLASLFLTLFSYFILRVYFHAKKAEQYEEFITRYTRGCKTIARYREGIPEHHIALGNAYAKLSTELTGIEYNFYAPPSWIPSLSSTMKNISFWCFWEDAYQ